jgi:hypothetical protein
MIFNKTNNESTITIMKNLKIAGLVMIIMVAMLSTSCSSNKSTGGSAANPELWKTLKDADWASWTATTGCEMKFVGEDKAIVMDWQKDPVSQAWNRTTSDVGNIEFIDENWFVVHYYNKSVAYLFTKTNSTYESSNGATFGKNTINAFRKK